MTVKKEAEVPLQTFEVATSILWVIIAISIYSNLQNGINRGKQRRLMADMRSIGEAMAAYYKDYGRYPPVKSTIEDIQTEIQP
jgi:type II secretory pathway pseudopilin PulG